MLKDLDNDIKAVYKTEDDDIIRDFYIKVLPEATIYKRAVGFFSMSTLIGMSKGLVQLFNNKGHAKFIVSTELKEEDYNIIQKGYDQKAIGVINDTISEYLIEIFQKTDNSDVNAMIEIVSWLITHGFIEFKVAVRRKGMYHEKIGIIEDDYDNKIVFNGSSNETNYGTVSGFNYESINVFKSWKEGHLEYCTPHIEGFDRLWSNNAKDTVVIEFPNDVKEFISENAQNRGYRAVTEDEYQRVYDKIFYKQARKIEHADNCIPTIPEKMFGGDFNLRDHQKQALNKWKHNDFHGIFDLVTGAGKTITAIYAIVKLYEANKKQKQKLFTIIAVPYINLADQWCEELELFNIFPVKCYNSSSSWESDLSNKIHLFKHSDMDFACVVVVNNTLKSDKFQNTIDRIHKNDAFFIGDECHHHGSKVFSSKLLQNTKYRLGLSGTPLHHIDEEKNQRLISYYGDIAHSYTLDDAIKDKVLTPYDYNLIFVDFSEDEASKYCEISDKIKQINAMIQNGGDTSTSKEQLDILYSQRTRLIGSIEGKTLALQKQLDENGLDPFTLIYSGDGRVKIDDDTDNDNIEDTRRQIETISKMLHKNNYSFSRFTSDENAMERRSILNRFKEGETKAMLAIKCLDEGINIPACKTAYILASSTDPRQFIQRRGRILRRYPGKDKAIIYDFITMLPKKYNVKNYREELFEREFKRINEFKIHALNKDHINDQLKQYIEEFDSLDEYDI